MIYVSKEQLRQVEYLIGQSIQGHHVLFDNETVRRIFNSPLNANFNEKGDEEMQGHIEKLILQPTIMQKRAYLERLPGPTFEKMVRTYFSIVENNLYENNEVKH